ncbi:hypothetical protein PAPYR_7110 [Paratrimastix pyriformis]|uniref:Uncharacterized protein n=1 Tax=Paratrimastix pyriformis TaxID=342808 RepID=A0ABQ8UDR5_9EUKA|nr:hypothetical protein PAPYR_7110 [Paratrimastix pyriformis]
MKLWMIFRVAHSLGPDILVTFAGQRALESEENTLTTLTDSEGFSSDRSGTTRRVPIPVQAHYQVASRGAGASPGTHQVTLNAVIFLLDMAHGLNSLIDNPEYYYTAPSWETRRHGTRAPSGTDSLALEAMSEANSWGNYYQVVKSRGCTFPHCTVHAEGVHFL